MSMSDLAVVFDRLTNEADFADALRRDPVAALSPYELSTDELRRLERALNASVSLSDVWASDSTPPTSPPDHHATRRSA
jgi:hypothetical protein